MTEIYLSEITRSDLPYIHWVENLEAFWHINEHPGPFSLEEITDFFFPPKKYFLHKQQRWIIRTSASKQPIGIMDAFNFNENEKSIGIGILIPSSDNHNQGFGKSAVQELIKKLTFDNYVENVFALIDKDNFPSLSLFEKSSFTLINEQICLNRKVNRYERKIEKK